MTQLHAKRITRGHYEYRGYELYCCGYHQPDHCVWWEACKIGSGNADYHATTKREIMSMIDEDEDKALLHFNP